MQKFEKFNTKLVQSIGNKEGAVSQPVVGSASFSYGTPETAEGIFDGSIKKPLYSRMGNPTSAKLESVLADMDGGVGAIVTSSGMAATTLATMSLLRSGDEIISIGGLFGGTYSFFSETLSRFGITTQFFDVDDLGAIKGAITQNTKILFLESVGNPNMRLPDIAKIAQIANEVGVVLIVDNTITPISVTPLELGADIVVYSTTKIISGNSSALGGAVVFRAIKDEDKFRGQRYKDLHKFIKKMGKTALIANGKKRAMRDFGMSANAQASYLTLLGLETLPLRLERIVNSTEVVAQKLDEAGLHVNHPSLGNHPHNKRYNTLFKDGCGTLMGIDFGTKERAFKFLRATKLSTITANIGDSRTLALHTATTIYSDFSDQEREFLGITDGLVRISIGLESPEDIVADFLKAANSLTKDCYI
ncbi:MAG: aminotransferase class I/II-fold pyridoxal phosphate-dependent enzyme [Campylobacterota bacterium]|nr:aminotransferase class I/II-fold pyridoxal phosphate-dependent enzyme [Campylobacterota bacterium]